jgi:predicted transporter
MSASLLLGLAYLISEVLLPYSTSSRQASDVPLA